MIQFDLYIFFKWVGSTHQLGFLVYRRLIFRRRNHHPTGTVGVSIAYSEGTGQEKVKDRPHKT